MSTNFHITAKRDICVVNIGCIEVQEMNCNLVWQTPTEITYQIMQSSDKMQPVLIGYFQFLRMQKKKFMQKMMYLKKEIQLQLEL